MERHLPTPEVSAMESCLPPSACACGLFPLPIILSVLYLGKGEEKEVSRLFMQIMFWQWVAPMRGYYWWDRAERERRDRSYLLLADFLPLRINLQLAFIFLQPSSCWHWCQPEPTCFLTANPNSTWCAYCHFHSPYGLRFLRCLAERGYSSAA